MSRTSSTSEPIDLVFRFLRRRVDQFEFFELRFLDDFEVVSYAWDHFPAAFGRFVKKHSDVFSAS